MASWRMALSPPALPAGRAEYVAMEPKQLEAARRAAAVGVLQPGPVAALCNGPGHWEAGVSGGPFWDVSTTALRHRADDGPARLSREPVHVLVAPEG